MYSNLAIYQYRMTVLRVVILLFLDEWSFLLGNCNELPYHRICTHVPQAMKNSRDTMTIHLQPAAYEQVH